MRALERSNVCAGPSRAMRIVGLLNVGERVRVIAPNSRAATAAVSMLVLAAGPGELL